MPEFEVGVIGASSFVGDCLLSQLAEAGCHAIAFSRRANVCVEGSKTDWRKLPEAANQTLNGACSIASWICAAPIWVLPEYFSMLESYNVRKVVVLSSTSRFTKEQSSDLAEKQLAKRLADTESLVQIWAEQHNIEWVILRPTLIYGLGQDKNVAEIVRIIRRFGFFLLFGKAQGLRQPIHVEDVAAACISALQSPRATNCAFNISGGEILAYRDMVLRIFSALTRQPHLFTVPLWLFRFAIMLVRLIPRYRHWSAAMAERMNHDMVFDYSNAAHAFSFKPRSFILTNRDLP